jgi:tRNA (guanine37-N1)-methyltransferase
VRVDIFSLFPEMFAGPFDSSILKRAVSQGIVNFKIHNIRDYSHDKHHTVDDYAYGGGAGMVMKPDAVFEAVETIREQAPEMKDKKLSIILLTPQGRLFNQKIAVSMADNDWLMFICGHYEGLDERIREHLVTDEISIGDYVLTGGELASMVVVDAVVRLIPGVLGSGESLLSESHTGGLLEYPQYTRPEIFRNWKVPDVLLSGNHAQIAQWRREQAIIRTFKRRPDLLNKAELSFKEQEYTADLSTEDQKNEND